MKVGDLVKDLGTGETGVIIQVKPLIKLDSGSRVTFDYKILSDGHIFCVDADEIKAVNL